MICEQCRCGFTLFWEPVHCHATFFALSLACRDSQLQCVQLLRQSLLFPFFEVSMMHALLDFVPSTVCVPVFQSRRLQFRTHALGPVMMSCYIDLEPAHCHDTDAPHSLVCYNVVASYDNRFCFQFLRFPKLHGLL